MNFGDKLFHAIQKTSPICVGIDPRIDSLPKFLRDAALEEYGDTAEGVAAAFTDFSLAIIDATADLVPAIKPQMAFFEMYGSAGIRAFEDVCQYAQEKGLLVIADGKRNDIGTTAEAYAQAFLGKVPLLQKTESVNFCDALTVNPYLGTDGIEPFVNVCNAEGKGIFVLVKTSNPSSFEVQDLATSEEMVHEEVARLVSGWGNASLGENYFSNVGAVVGATYPDEAKYLRSLMPNQFFLVPGYGAQGAGAAEVRPCFNVDGTGAIINSSRGIIFAYKNNKKYSEENFDEAAREAVLAMKADLASVL